MHEHAVMEMCIWFITKLYNGYITEAQYLNDDLVKNF